MTKSRFCTPGTAPDRRIIACEVRLRESGVPLLDYLTRRFTYRDRDGWTGAVAAGEFSVNGAVAAAGLRLQAGDRLEWRPGELSEPEVDSAYAVVYEEDGILGIDKPGNLPVHPAGPFFRHTLWYLLSRRYGEVHPVNRLDRETSGVVLFARSSGMAAALARQLPAMDKRYLALVHGEFREPVDADGWLSPDPASRVRKKQRWSRTASPGGVSARTLLTPRDSAGGLSLVEARPVTGRLHQIRATLHSLGFPVVGDKLYGVDEALYLKIRSNAVTGEDYRRLGMRRQALHAAHLSFRHPLDQGREIVMTAPLPEDFRAAFKGEWHE